MADEHDAEFEQAGSGASQFFPQQASALRKNGHVLIKSRPCKIVEMSTSKTGKHGHAKIHMVGIDIFTKKKLEDICPSTHNMNVPNVKRKEYQVVDLDDDGFYTLMDEAGEDRMDLKHTDICEEDLATARQMLENLPEGQELTASVTAAMGEEAIIKLRYTKSQ